MKATWITKHGESDFCGLMSPMKGHVRLAVDDTLHFDMSGEQAHSLLNQIAYPSLENDFHDGSVLYINEGEFRTMWFNSACLSLSVMHVEFLQAELERVLKMQPKK